MTFKCPPTLFALACPNPINMATMTKHYIEFFFTTSPTKQTSSPHMPPGLTNSPTSPLHTNKPIVQVHLLQESDLQLSKPKKAP